MQTLLHRLCFGAMACAAAAAPAQTVKTLLTSDPVAVMRPLFTDSLSPTGLAYKDALLLSSSVPALLKASTSHTAEADTAGWFDVAPAPEGLRLVTYQALVRPERYAKGSLQIETNAMVQTYLNGEKNAAKESAGDSICEASAISVPLTMMPQATSVVSIRLLADTAQNIKMRVKYIPDDEYEDVAVSLAADGKRRYELRDMGLGPKASGIKLSPDGKYVMVKYSERLDKDTWRTGAQVLDTKTLQPVLAEARGYDWMPSGSTLWRAVKVDGGYDILTLDPAAGREKCVAKDVPSQDVIWSPNADYLLYYDTDKGDPIGSPLRRYRDPDDRLAGNRMRMFLKKYDIATGLVTSMVYGNRQSSLADISPDGSKLLIGVADYDPTMWPFYFNSLYQLDCATMAVDTLVSKDPGVVEAVYSPDGKSIFVVGSPDAFGGIGVNCGPHPIANSSDQQGYIFDIASRKAKAVTRDFDPSITGDPVWSKADGCVYFLAENGFRNTAYRFDPATGAIKELPQDVEYVQAFSVAEEQGRYFAYNGQGRTSSGRAYLLDLKTGKQRLVADPWAEVADAIDWGKSEQWNFIASDGTEIEGYLTFPPDFDPSKKYPTIVYYYGGTAPTKHNTYSPYNPQVFASRGYIVYQLNPSGTPGYGQEFSARHVNAWGDYTASDIIEGVKKLTATHQYVDSAKIAAIGASYGGFMTQYLMTLTDIFAAGVAHAGISNVASYWGVGDWGYSYNALAASKSYPWNNPDLYTKHGSLFNADKIHTPLLLLHGAADNNVPPGESIQLFNALKILGRDVELITVDDEDHYISGYNNRLDWQNTIMAYFAKYLQNDPRWWNELYCK